jgi:hypothetical protein
MPSIFADLVSSIPNNPAHIKSAFGQISGAQLLTAAAISISTAVKLVTIRDRASKFSITNETNAEIQVWLVNPEDPNKYLHPFLTVGAGQPFNIDNTISPTMFFPSGTEFHVSYNGTIANNSDMVRLFLWLG